MEFHPNSITSSWVCSIVAVTFPASYFFGAPGREKNGKSFIIETSKALIAEGRFFALRHSCRDGIDPRKRRSAKEDSELSLEQSLLEQCA